MPETSRSMVRRLRGPVSALTVGVAALAFAAPLPAMAVVSQARKAAVDPVSVMTYTAREQREALAYWTPARITAVGKSVDLGPTGPMSKPWHGTAMKTVGRIFFVNSHGSDTWCTATAVQSANRSTVMTAAHCVRRGSSPYFTSLTMVFVPNYGKGKQPYGAFAVRMAATPRTWEEASNDDMSALVVDADKNGRELTDVVGGQAIAFNRAVGGTISSFGYPATSPQLGEVLLRCVGKATKKADYQAIPCDMTGGSSGGPWLADFNATTGKGVLVSVNSALDSFEPTEMYGEVFGAMAQRVYDRAQHG